MPILLFSWALKLAMQKRSESYFSPYCIHQRLKISPIVCPVNNKGKTLAPIFVFIGVLRLMMCKQSCREKSALIRWV